MNKQMNESDNSGSDGENFPFTSDDRLEGFPSIDRLLSAPEVAYILGVPVSRIYIAARRGEIPVVKVGKIGRAHV